MEAGGRPGSGSKVQGESPRSHGAGSRGPLASTVKRNPSGHSDGQDVGRGGRQSPVLAGGARWVSGRQSLPLTDPVSLLILWKTNRTSKPPRIVTL